MILNTGSRTDIPAYYSNWFFNRIKAGYVLARNPYYPTQVTKYLLNPEVIDVMVFCTKNPSPMLDRLSLFLSRISTLPIIISGSFTRWQKRSLDIRISAS